MLATHYNQSRDEHRPAASFIRLAALCVHMLRPMTLVGPAPGGSVRRFAYIKPLMLSAQSSELSDPPTAAAASLAGPGLSPPLRDLLDCVAELITAAPLSVRGFRHELSPPLHPARSTDTVVPRRSRCLYCSEGPSLALRNNSSGSVQPGSWLQRIRRKNTPTHARSKKAVTAADSRRLPAHVIQDWGYLWQPIIPSDQKGSASKPVIVYLLRGELCQLLRENGRWVVQSGAVVLSLTLTPRQPPPTPRSDHCLFIGGKRRLAGKHHMAYLLLAESMSYGF